MFEGVIQRNKSNDNVLDINGITGPNYHKEKYEIC